MIQVRRYRPAFFEGYPIEELEVGSLEELLEVDWVKNWTTSPGFHRFSVSRHYQYHNLMAEFKEGKEWWVVAILEGEEPEAYVTLPEWTPPFREDF